MENERRKSPAFTRPPENSDPTPTPPCANPPTPCLPIPLSRPQARAARGSPNMSSRPKARVVCGPKRRDRGQTAVWHRSPGPQLSSKPLLCLCRCWALAQPAIPSSSSLQTLPLCVTLSCPSSFGLPLQLIYSYSLDIVIIFCYTFFRGDLCPRGDTFAGFPKTQSVIRSSP